MKSSSPATPAAWTCTALAVAVSGCAPSDPAGREPPPAVDGAVGPATSCVETYSPAALGDRAFAFDGTVRDIGEGRDDLGYVPVTFDVRQWFRGGGAAQVTVAMPPPGQVDSAGGDTLTYDVGARLLVSGEPRWGGKPLDDPVAWLCGFTRSYDEATAAQWRRFSP